jgi:hypothetical protein
VTFRGRESGAKLDYFFLETAGDCGPDQDCSGCIDHQELMVFIDRWKAGQATLAQLMEAIAEWKTGC